MTFANKITNYSCDFKSKSSSIAESTIGCRKKSSRLPPVPLFFFLRKSLKSTIGRWRTTVYLRPSYKCVSVWPLSRALPVAPRDTTQASRSLEAQRRWDSGCTQPSLSWRLRKLNQLVGRFKTVLHSKNVWACLLFVFWKLGLAFSFFYSNVCKLS